MKCFALILIGIAALCFAPLARTARRMQGTDPALAPETVTLLDGMLDSTQLAWTAAMPAAREAARRNPRGVIEYLVGKLEVDRAVAGERFESQIYNVCGNALALLEELTDERICGLGRDWIGFSTHDHRSTRPSIEKVQGPWLAWLGVRAGLPIDEWFWGLSYAELEPLSALMRRLPAEWSPAELDAVRALGPEAYPYLLDKLADGDVAVGEQRFCNQANALLRRLTDQDLGAIEQIELLRLDPEDPARKHRLAILNNRASMSMMQRRWTSTLLAR